MAEDLILKQYAIAMQARSVGYKPASENAETLRAASDASAKALEEAEQQVKAAKNEEERKKSQSDRDAKKEKAASDAAELKTAESAVRQYGAWATLTTSPIEEAYYAKALYDAQLVSHKEVVARQQEFVRRANESLKGRSKVLEGRKAGTIVTIKALVKPIGDSEQDVKAANDAGAITVSYYVQSEMPLVFHAGLAWTNLKSFDYQQVQKNLSTDIYQQIAKPDNAIDLSIFMTYLLTPTSDNWASGLGLTIGTGVTDLGKKLFLGGTAKFSDHLLLTAGGLSKTVTDSTGRAISEDGKLFDAIKRVQKWGWFVSFTATPF